MSIRKLNEISRKALRDGNKVIVELLPDEVKEDYLKRENGRIANSRTIAYIPQLDKVINPNKWYMMFFDKDDSASVVPLSFFSQAVMIKWYKHKLGTPKLENIFPRLGKEVIEQNLLLRKYIYYKDIRTRIVTKMIFPPEIRLAHSRKSFKKTLKKQLGVYEDTKENEKIFFDTLFKILPKYKTNINTQAIINNKYKQNKQNNGIKKQSTKTRT